MGEAEDKALLAAAEKGDEAAVRAALDAGANVNCKDGVDAKTPLHYAATLSYEEVYKAACEDTGLGDLAKHHAALCTLLCERGADLSAIDNTGDTPLHFAATEDVAALCTALCELGADVNAKSADTGWRHWLDTPLHRGARGGSAAVCVALCERGADVNAKNSCAQTPLHYAATNGKDASCTALCERGAGVNAKDDDGKTPLLVGAENCFPYVCTALCELGADVNAQTSDGMTALHYAAREGLAALCVALCERGADVNAKNEDGETPMDLAGQDDDDTRAALGAPLTLLQAAEKGDEAAVRAALDAGADVNCTDGSNGWTPLHKAARHEHLAICTLLCERGADVNAKDITGETPLHFAALSDEGALCTALCELGADVNARSGVGCAWQPYYGTSPLHLAREATCVALCECGADVNAKSNDGNTRLHTAAQGGEAAMCTLLCERGADVNAKNEDGKTPMDMARDDDTRAALRASPAPKAA